MTSRASSSRHSSKRAREVPPALPRPSGLVDGAGRVWDAIANKGFIAERKLQVNERCGNMLRQIKSRKWEALVDIKERAAPQVVREFYANLSVTSGNVVNIRGVSVNISPMAINKFLKVRVPQDDELFPMLANPVYDEWHRTLAHPSATYVMKKGNRAS